MTEAAPKTKPMSKPAEAGAGGGIAAHVKTHGPAHSISYHHDKKTNKHHITSTHGDGQTHQATLPDAEAAKQHFSAALGAGGETPAATESPDEAMATPTGEGSASGLASLG